ncbi:MAG: hypothetical protein SOY60_05250 [Fusobacterium gastrosuis]|uniref:hypothetical protein n=1 Tax=Fusobacterium gastrosuis TaxID=1755100 RepID=UPI002972EE12|nr:hypothetical protein [Fusobacteriaceae bacterium]MDY4011053.1 hypothetical protein [Fusobacterium gastrosuis]MDY5714115.1 hypothetical protein [Fusobacterium gastrosuis]
MRKKENYFLKHLILPATIFITIYFLLFKGISLEEKFNLLNEILDIWIIRLLFILVFIINAFKFILFPSEKYLNKVYIKEKLKELTPEKREIFIKNTKGIRSSSKINLLIGLENIEDNDEFLENINKYKKILGVEEIEDERIKTFKIIFSFIAGLIITYINGQIFSGYLSIILIYEVLNELENFFTKRDKKVNI